MTKEISIGDNIRPYLDEIAEKLWSTPSHAAIMVGAGFSKNANKDFPDWSTLGDLFFEKLHGKKPENSRYLSPLKLADEVQAAFGRPVLNSLLRLHIPDETSSPSPLHIKLLELPWSDVFTTNYDTLLERARDSISLQKFDVVNNKDDLIYSEKPRIIKLHGSFPSGHPFIITEEDYRTYPRKFAPFVNTVQQSLLENILCLIGFSGDDPNFLQWIGWIRDNLGKENAPKIYLIGIINLSEVQKKLLEQRNIVVINLALSPSDRDHYVALERFFDYLLSRKKEENRLGWPENLKTMTPDQQKDQQIQVKEILFEWKEARLSYPKWVTVPSDRRNTLWVYTKSWAYYMSNKIQWQDPFDLYFLFELDWRFARCLMPIFNHLEIEYEKILEKYWPFKISGSISSSICILNSDYKDLNWDEIQYMWIQLALSILRYYREEGKFEKWNVLCQKINNELFNFLSPEQKAFFYYERVLCALFQLDIPLVNLELNRWPSDFSMPLWEAKRAGILAEIGENNKAVHILELSLNEVRSKLNLKPVTIDYSFVSEEASIMLLVQYIKNTYFSSENTQIEEQKENRRQLSKRWDILRQYKCDPWHEITQFDNKLEKTPIEQKNIIEKVEFDIGKIRTTRHFGDIDNEGVLAYNFLRYFEELGLPFRINGASLGKKSADGAIQRLYKYSPNWAVVTLIRIGDEKITNRIFNRQSLLNFNVNNIDMLIDEYLNVLKNAESDIIESKTIFIDNFGVLLARLIPEILSRLCCKCSRNKTILLLEFVSKIYASKEKNKYIGIGTLLSRLMKTLSQQEQYFLIPKLLEITYPKNGIFMDREYPNPFKFIQIDKNNIDSSAKLTINPSYISQLFSLARSKEEGEREWGICSLVNLFKINLLTDKQISQFSKVLWAQIDNNGFPSNTGYYKHVLLTLPHPQDIDVAFLLKKYIENTDFPIQALKKDESISIVNGDISLCTEIIGASQHIAWSQEEIFSLLDKIFIWWDLDKDYLLVPNEKDIFGSISEEFRTRFINLIYTLSAILANLQKKIIPEKYQKIIQQLIQELDHNKFNTVQLKTVASPWLTINENTIFTTIKNALYSSVHEEVVDALFAILELLKTELLTNKNSINELLVIVGQKISWRNSVGFVSCLNVILIIVQKYPYYWKNILEPLCLSGIKFLANETSLNKEMSEFTFAEKLKIRKATANLASELIKYYKNNEFEIPEEILIWENICRNENEFAEIRLYMSIQSIQF